MKKILWLVLLSLALISGIASAQTPEPTQTPYIIYVVVTATPEPEAMITGETEEPMIERPTATEAISLANPSGTTSGGTYAGSTDELIRIVEATAVAQAPAATGGSTQPVTSTGGATVRNTDGTTCTMNFELISEPSYPAGSIIPRGQVFWKEWLIRNTGSCTWTAAWEFVFDSGWQIGNTRFHMNRTTAPGETLLVRLAMVPDQKQNGNYYSTYAFEAPDGTRFGKITSSYTVQDPSYFAPKPTMPPGKNKPQHGHEAGPVPCWPYWTCPPCK